MDSNNRPHIVCHMLTSVDGKITGPFMKTPAVETADRHYESINESFSPQAWLCGRVTADDNFTFYKKPETDVNAPTVPDGDFVAVADAPMYYVSVDASGRLAWTDNTLHYANRPPAHIIEVLTGKASNAYRAFLRRLGISYIMAGEKCLDCALAAEKLKILFGIERLMVSGGGYVNGSFLAEGLVDELSIVIAPATDISSDTVSLFERMDCLPRHAPVEFELAEVKRLEGGCVWLHYKTTQMKTDK